MERKDGVDNVAASSDDGGSVVGISLTIVGNAKDLKTLTFKKLNGRHVDLLRGSMTTSSEQGVLKAMFSCPVMSRKHARVSFLENGTVCIIDLNSLHGTFLKSNSIVTKLVANKIYTLRSDDTITLGKSVHRDDKKWEPVTLQVHLLTDSTLDPASSQTTKVSPSSLALINARTASSSRAAHAAASESGNHSPNRFGYYPSSGSSSSDMSTSEADDDDVQSDAENSGTGPSVITSPLAPVNVAAPRPSRISSILPFNMGHHADKDRPLPSIRQLRSLPSIRQLGLMSPLRSTLRDGAASYATSLLSAGRLNDFGCNSSSQSVIDLTRFDDIPFPSSVVENQLGASLQLGGSSAIPAAGSGSGPPKRVVYDSDGNELSEDNDDDESDNENMDEYEKWINDDEFGVENIPDVAASINHSNLNEDSRNSSPMQISTGIPSRPASPVSEFVREVYGNTSNVASACHEIPQDAGADALNYDEEDEEEIGVLSFGDAPFDILDNATSGSSSANQTNSTASLRNIFKFSAYDNMPKRPMTASEVANASETGGSDAASVSYAGEDADMQDIGIHRAALLEESQSSLFLQGPQAIARDENSAIEGRDQSEPSSRFAQIYNRFSNLRDRLGQQVADRQLVAAALKFLGGGSVQERELNELRRQVRDQQQQQEREQGQLVQQERSKVELRHIVREEMTRVDAEMAVISSLLQEVLVKQDNPAPVRVIGDQSIQTEPPVQDPPPAQSSEVVESESTSKKRKRSDDVDLEEQGQLAQSSSGGSSSTTDESDTSSRPEKRMRFWCKGRKCRGPLRNASERPRARRSFASAVGLVSLGVVAAAAAYTGVSDEFFDWVDPPMQV